MTDKTPKGTKIKTYRREVSVALTDAEVEAAGRKMAKRKILRDSLVDKAKQAQKSAQGDIAKETSEINRLADAIDTGKELRNSEVEDWIDGSQVFTYVVGEYKEPIDQRPAGFADEQTDMFADPEVPEPPVEKPKKGRGKKKTAVEPGAIGGSDEEHGTGDFQPPPAAPAKKKRGKKA